MEPPTETGALPPKKEMMEGRVLTRVIFVVLKWSRDGSNSAVASDVRILNENDFAIQDIEIACQQIRNSDAGIIAHSSQKLSRVIGAKGVLAVYGIRTGFRIRQGARVTCWVNSFARF
jgi:hypothetical protein